MLYYNPTTNFLNEVYSLDMVRLNFDLGGFRDDFVKYLNNLSGYNTNIEIKYYSSFKQYSYRHQWTLYDLTAEKKHCCAISWTIGLDLGRDAFDSTKGFIEFNPNKCMNSPLFVDFWRYFMDCTYCGRELVRYDMAIDLSLPRDHVKLIRDGKKNYEYKHLGDGVTEYQGVRNNHGFVKVYDKMIESKLNTPLTRVELTLNNPNDLKNIFPIVWLYEYPQAKMMLAEDNALSDTQFILARCIRESSNPNEYLHCLSYRIRKKIEPYLHDKVLSLDSSSAFTIYKQALSYTS